MPITIVSTLEGYRRAGMAHSKTPVSHPDGTFSKQQLAQLQADPRITITMDGVLVEGAAAQDAQASPADSASAEPEAQGQLDDGQLASLMTCIAELDSENPELWTSDKKPKVESLPEGTTAKERDEAWDAYIAQLDTVDSEHEG